MATRAIADDRPARHVLDRLWDTIEARRDADPGTSYVASLLARHPDKPAQKMAEEAAEVVVEAVRRRRPGVVGESADLLFHLLVLLAGAGVSREAIYREIAARMRASALIANRRPKITRRILGTSKIP